MRLIALLACFLCLSAAATAQDVHYTLHDYHPLWLNPAQTGGYSGSLRVGGIFRGQWEGLSAIRSPSAFADAPIIKGFRKYDWIGAGASLVTDRAGSGNQTIKQSFFGVSASYHLALDNKRRNVVTLGAQYGSTSFGFETEGNPVQQLNIDAELGGDGQENQSEFEPEMGGNMPGNRNNNSASYTDINAGLMLRSVIDPKKNNLLEVGVAMLHLNSPRFQSLFRTQQGTGMDTTMMTDPPERAGSAERRRKPTIHLHGRLDLEINDKYRFQPTAFLQNSNGNTSVSLQAWGARNLKPDVDLRAGLGYRTGDAVKLMLGADIKQLRAALSYDFITLNGPFNVSQGAFELGVNYIFNFYKKPTVVPTMLCPRI